MQGRLWRELIPGPYYFPAEAVKPTTKARQDEKRRVTREFVEARRKAGDRFIGYVNGLEMLSPEHPEDLVDGVQENSIGLYFCAKGLEAYLRKALRMDGRPPR